MNRYFLTILFALAFNPTFSKPINTCHDPVARADWRDKMKKYGHQPEWRSMYALRQDICRQIDAGALSVEDGTREFERQRLIYIERLRERLERKHGKQKAAG